MFTLVVFEADGGPEYPLIPQKGNICGVDIMCNITYKRFKPGSGFAVRV
jgi:hypothetical protein